jgi:SAM-dependent methyltransferase
MAKIRPFEEYTSEYERWFRENQLIYIAELNAIMRVLPRTGKGLDIGVGTGRFAAPFGIDLGLEPSIRMLKIARQHGIQVIKGIAEALPFKSDRFDFALMVTTICFLDDIGSAFREVHRILKRGGRFVIGFIDRNSSLGKIYEKDKKGSEFYKMATFYSVREVISRLKQSGFGHFNFCQTVFHPLNDIRGIEPVVNGFGQGSFVAISAENKG